MYLDPESSCQGGGLIFGVLDSGSSFSGLSADCGHCFVFLDKTLYSYSASLHPGV